MLPDYSNMSKIARELAMDMLPAEDIQRIHKLEDEEWQRIMEHPQFQSMLTDMIAEWNGAGNAKARIRMKAATGVEAALETILDECFNSNAPLSQKVDAIKMLAKLGDLEQNVNAASSGGGGGGDRVVIQINMAPGQGREPEVVTIDAPFTRQADDADPV